MTADEVLAGRLREIFLAMATRTYAGGLAPPQLEADWQQFQEDERAVLEEDARHAGRPEGAPEEIVCRTHRALRRWCERRAIEEALVDAGEAVAAYRVRPGGRLSRCVEVRGAEPPPSGKPGDN